MVKVLVTGGSGFIGTNLLLDLKGRGFSVLSLDPKPPRCSELGDVTQIVDPLSPAEVSESIRRFAPDFIYHLGARTDLSGNSVNEYSENTEGLNIVLNAISGCSGIRAVFFASSRLVCKIGYNPRSENDYCPTTAYGESKKLGELMVRESKLTIPWCIFRPTSIWGPWFDIPYKTFFLMVAAGRYIHPRGESIRKSFGFVGNSVHQLSKLMEMPPAIFHGRTFNLCDSPAIEVGAWSESIAREMGVRPPRRVPLAVLKALAYGGDFLSKVGVKNPPLTRFRLDNLMTQMEMDSRFVDGEIGALPYTCEEGIRITVDWLRKTGQIR